MKTLFTLLFCRFHLPLPGWGGHRSSLDNSMVEVLKTCRTPSICYEESQGGSLLTHKPCFTQRRYLLSKVNAPRAFCVLIFTAHRHQYCGGYWHFCLESQTKTRWLGSLTTLRAELWPSSLIPPDLSWSGMPHETLRTTLKTH